MRLVRATWVMLQGDAESHAVSATVFGRWWQAYCGKQWGPTIASEVIADRGIRCWSCQRRVIEAAEHAARIGDGLAELERSVLWSADMVDA